MSHFRPSTFLRAALIGDAAASGATGLLTGLGAGFCATLLELPEDLLRTGGLVLIPYAAAVAFLGTRESLSPGSVWAVIVANVIWVAASALLLLSGAVAPNALGYAFVIAQAVVVAGFADAQFLGLRRAVAPLTTAAA